MNRKFSKAYFEITNECNAKCSFCPGTERKKHFVSSEEFDLVLSKLEGRAEYLYFHIMGEPLLHPLVSQFAQKANSCGFKVMITTNGLLADTRGLEMINTGSVFKLSISLHSFEANRYNMTLEKYLKNCFDLAETACRKGTITALRLWNLEGPGKENTAFNSKVIRAAQDYFGCTLTKNRTGYRIKDGIYIEFGERFDWPGHAGTENNGSQFCHALRLQFGILCDGTVVPCCLDSEGSIALGNIFSEDLDEILSCDRVRLLYDSFTDGVAACEICRKCGFARRFSAKKN